jgi:hypothetical protein
VWGGQLLSAAFDVDLSFDSGCEKPKPKSKAADKSGRPHFTILLRHLQS